MCWFNLDRPYRQVLTLLVSFRQTEQTVLDAVLVSFRQTEQTGVNPVLVSFIQAELTGD